MSKMLLRLSAFSLIIILASCAPKKVEIPQYRGGIEDMIKERSSIESIEATLSLKIEKHDGIISGDAFLALTEKTLELRVYSMGFLTAELYAQEGAVKSNPALDAGKEAIVVDGIRNSILWWSIKGYRVEETEDEYILRNSWKKLVVDKKTMLPKSQRIELGSAGLLDVSYGKPQSSGNIWYPSEIRIEVLRYAINLDIKEISFTEAPPGQ